MQASAIYDPMGHRAIYFIISSDPVKFQGTADFFFFKKFCPLFPQYFPIILLSMLFVFLHHPCFCFTSGVGKVICVAVFLLGCQTALLVDMISGCDPTSALYKKTNYGHMTNGAKGLRVSLKRL